MELSPFLYGLYKLSKYALYPLTWLILLLGLLVWLASGSRSDHRVRWIRRLAILMLCLIFVLGNHRVAAHLVALIEMRAPPAELTSAQQFDAIVVLGGGIQAKGTLRPSDQLTYFSIVRTMCGADLYARGLAPRLVLSGGDASVFGQGPKEAREMKRLAMRLGVPEQAILLEEGSRTTYENATGTRKLLGDASILLTTSAYHMPRAQALFRKQGFAVTAYPCTYSSKYLPGQMPDLTMFDMIPDVEALRVTTHAINELMGILVYRLAGNM
jgi:uncharacterized SAM-binding protein YcdF (DUF218 family)